MAPLNPFAPLFIPSAAAAADPFSLFPCNVAYLQIYHYQQPNYNYHYSCPRPHLNINNTIPLEHANEHEFSAGCYYNCYNMPLQMLLPLPSIYSDASAPPLSEEMPCIIKEVVKQEQEQQQQKQEKKKKMKMINCPDHYEVKRAIIVKPNFINKWKSEGSTITTLMIRNIPNKFDKKKVLDILDGHCRKINEKLQAAADHGGGDHVDAFSEFDFLYLPMDFRTRCNYGYVFVNFTTPTTAQRLYADLHGKCWANFGSRKVCEVTEARIQGLPALLSHFRNSIFVCENGDYRPVHFTPSRNGTRSTNQQYIGRHMYP